MKFFSVHEANQLIPHVEANLNEIKAAIQDLEALRLEVLNKRPRGVRAINISQEIGFLLSYVRDMTMELENMGILLHDLEAGSVNFPSQLGSEIVKLHWAQGQNHIAFYVKPGHDELIPLPREARV